ncbi:MAG: mitochondrial fission ELM1 family protein [Pseudomonadota bacterium]
MTKATEIWVLTDGRAGNEVQALALAEAVARRRPGRITVKRTPLKRWASWVPAAVSYRLGASKGGWPFIGIEDGASPLTWPWPGLIISAGRRVAPISAALRKLHGVPAVHLLDPEVPKAAFDAVVVPRHDNKSGANIIPSLGALSRHNRQSLDAAAASWRCPMAGLKLPRLAVLIGGPSRSADFTDEDAQRLILALDSLANRFGLMITASRRTPEAIVARLRDALADRAFIWAGETDGPNPYPGLLGPAVAVVVTEDSVNMASEAASTGKPVHIFPITRVAPKLAQFHADLRDYGATQRFTGEIRHWSYQPLAEADRVAKDLIRRSVI